MCSKKGQEAPVAGASEQGGEREEVRGGRGLGQVV